LYTVYVCRNPLGSHFQWGMNVNCSGKKNIESVGMNKI
jgi:hypothetical protein